ncbi:hypothetical protein C6P40_002724 [Pichia californica]|uniref:Uncharacterized protein n=1 Tax=Pichia californica TaxID=460514 RepID=A0A9P6WNX7_9ASCO|nr:hypothetical protein C6P42_003884 [[Candida] californica]KAG0690479.1 hypothetical protein C6P40_002724 [[Candida] californica]
MFTLYSFEGYFDFQHKFDVDAKYEIDYFDSIPSFTSVNVDDNFDYMEGNWIVDWNKELRDEDKDGNIDDKCQTEYNEYEGIAEMFDYSEKFDEGNIMNKTFNEEMLLVDLASILEEMTKYVNWDIENLYTYINNHITKISKNVSCMSVYPQIGYNYGALKLCNHSAYGDYCYGCHNECKIEWLDSFEQYEEKLIEERYLDDVYDSECTDFEICSINSVEIEIIENKTSFVKRVNKIKSAKKIRKHTRNNFRHSQCKKKLHKRK